MENYLPENWLAISLSFGLVALVVMTWAGGLFAWAVYDPKLVYELLTDFRGLLGLSTEDSSSSPVGT